MGFAERRHKHITRFYTIVDIDHLQSQGERIDSAACRGSLKNINKNKNNHRIKPQMNSASSGRKPAETRGGAPADVPPN
jgi:hypothetical protein